MAQGTELAQTESALQEIARKHLLAALQDSGLVEASSLARGRTIADRTGRPVEQVLNHMGVVSDEQLAALYAEVTERPVWDPEASTPDPESIDFPLDVSYLRRHRLLPIACTPEQFVYAACDPLDRESIAAMDFVSNRPSEVLVAKPSDWRRVFNQTYGSETGTPAPDERRLELELERLSDTGSDSEGARLILLTMATAVARGASDIHFEPRQHDLRIRLRIDGVLIEIPSASVDLASMVASRIKVLSGLDLGERRLPQDGRATFVVEGRPIDVRISILPSAFGEAAVLRLLNRSGQDFNLSNLGFGPRERGIIERVAASPHGIFLMAGPTGSGKTTTLYSILNSMSHSNKKILSVEDPIEYHFQHVVQTQVMPDIGLTFATALRSFLRQDPDVILVGEIRDRETSAIAVQAALTGHLVLASVHANDALRVIPRLLDMGVEPYQLAAALLGTAAQRLVRRLCPHCRRPRTPNAVEARFIAEVAPGTSIEHIYEAQGCAECAGLGCRGRIAIVESFLCDDDLSERIGKGDSYAAFAEAVRLQGMTSMARDGIQKASEGVTSLAEIMATLGS